MKRVKLLLIFFILLMGVYGLYVIPTKDDVTNQSGDLFSNRIAEASKTPTELISKKEVQKFLAGRHLANLTEKNLHVDLNGQTYMLETSIDMSLQAHIRKKLNTSTSLYIGIVVMQPDSGRILSMVSFDKNNPKHNPCVDSIFPAASIFKIVTAAAAIDQSNLSADSKLKYHGRKHTLYKSQLKESSNRYTYNITLKESFAHSINPVFGKLGIHYLGKSVLEKFAASFGFNREIPFEIPISPSLIAVSDEPYQWAEIASGFNRKTTLSPIHGALVGSVALNLGKMMEPSIIDTIYDESGQIIYSNQSVTMTQAISPRASGILNNLMAATVTSGTARKTFRGYRDNRTLSRLHIGGKTGSINNDPRYDWFVGFAEEKNGRRKIVVAAVVAHEKYIGIKASAYSRMAMEKYFKGYFSKIEEKNTKAN